MAQRTITVKVDRSIGVGEFLDWLPIITEAVLVYPQLQGAQVGQTVNSPTIPNLHLAHGHFDVVISFTKKA